MVSFLTTVRDHDTDSNMYILISTSAILPVNRRNL